jgi:hypothetical protein
VGSGAQKLCLLFKAGSCDGVHTSLEPDPLPTQTQDHTATIIILVAQSRGTHTEHMLHVGPLIWFASHIALILLRCAYAHPWWPASS